jgi:hypothetical protein
MECFGVAPNEQSQCLRRDLLLLRGIKVKVLTRRSFVGNAGGLSLAAAASLSSAGKVASAQLVYSSTGWKHSEFNTLLRSSARCKQVYDIRPIGDGKFLNNIKNSLNGLEFGFGIEKGLIKIVSAMHGPSNMLNFDDYAWAKYKLGELLQVKDPETSQPAMRNIYFPEKTGGSSDPNDPSSTLQDLSIARLQERGVSFLSCHMATEEQSRVLVKEHNLKQSVEEVVNDLQAHTLPGVLIVPAMVAAISLLQSDGHFTYITV